MDIQTRKLNFIQEFLRLQNEEIITKFEKMLRIEKKKSYEAELSPMSVDEFNNMIDSAEEDVREGRVIPVSKLKDEVHSWT